MNPPGGQKILQGGREREIRGERAVPNNVAEAFSHRSSVMNCPES